MLGWENTENFILKKYDKNTLKKYDKVTKTTDNTCLQVVFAQTAKPVKAFNKKLFTQSSLQKKT